MRNSAGSIVRTGHTRGTSGVHVARRAIGMQPLLLVDNSVAVVVLDGETKTRRVNALVAEEQERAEARLGQEVKHTVEDGFGVGRDDVATLAETPRNRVQDPQESSQAATHDEGTLDIGAVVDGVTAGLPDKLVYDVDESEAAWIY
jgi:hypothetical protein